MSSMASTQIPHVGHMGSYVDFDADTHHVSQDTTRDTKRGAAYTIVPQQDEAKSHSVDRVHVRPARSALSSATLLELFTDLMVLLAAVYFIAFGALVYQQDGRPVSLDRSQALLKAALYGPTFFPIVFAAVVAKALRSIAAFKLEQGSSVLTIEYLLASRTVFNAVKAPFGLRALTPLTPLLVALWALSPLGGQASLRLISTVPSTVNSTGEVNYLNFSSPFINGGSQSASASTLLQTDALFTSALIGPASRKAASQDEFGNVKIPMIEYSSTGGATGDVWTALDRDNVVYSSLTGLPYLGVSNASDVTTTFHIETSYMYANCSLSHSSPASPITNYSSNSTSPYYYRYYNGENYLISWDTNNTITMQNQPDHEYWVQFESIGSDGYCTWDYLTTAYCTLKNSFVEVVMECTGSDCHSTSIRRSQLWHPAANLVPPAGSANMDTKYMNYWPDLINSTYTEALCDASCCGSSPLEAYLLDPASPYSISGGSSPPLWPVGDELFSQRFSQLLNTYWIDSVAPSGLLGNFTVSDAYRVSNATAQMANQVRVIRCDRAWLAVLLLSSIVMLLVGISGAVLNVCRKGPEILDSFSGMLRHRAAVGIAHVSSMENAYEQAWRMREMKVRLGDVNPESEVGFVAIAPVGSGTTSVRKLRSGRRYG